ncbi:MAG: hypothetical protein DRJ01_15350 [Bacteroidetes bacterium]|nr:MAG: hypothetical protein DRJ01_15350 [Bacteroidota bacterium]
MALINYENNKVLDWKDLLINADNDFVSVVVLFYTNLIFGSTYAWLLPHTLEKYLKAYLLKANVIQSDDLKKYGHSLKRLWNKYNEISQVKTTKPKLNAEFENLVDELSKISTNTRYNGYFNFASGSAFYYFFVLSSLLRYLIIGKSRYRSSLYGLDDINMSLRFMPMMTENNISDSYSKIITQKVLHITLEHGCSFSNLGAINQMDFQNLSISNTAIFESLIDCPLCRGGKIYGQQELVKFYRTIKPINQRFKKYEINKSTNL